MTSHDQGGGCRTDDPCDDRRGRRRRAAALVTTTATLALIVSGCSGGAVSFSSPSTVDGSGSVGSDQGAATDGRLGTMGHGQDIPAIPEIVVPDVTTLTKNAEQINSSFGALAEPGRGVTVTGARCDDSGRITNGSSLTIVDGDGSGRVDGPGSSAVNDGDGAGRVDTADKSIIVGGDGSGRYDVAGLSIVIHEDGSGRVDTASTKVILNVDGSGRHDTADVAVINNGDGSGRYDTPELTVINNGDGSGRYDRDGLRVINNGDGTGTYRATLTAQDENRRMDPMPPLAKVGTFPPVASLKPIGSHCGTLIRLEDRVLFDFDSATLRPTAGPVLDAVAKVAAPVTGNIRVNGHTDSIGSDAYNDDLSARRAQAVADALAERGVRASLHVAGLGESQPVAPNTIKGKDNPGGRQLNRRVELVLPPT